MMAVTTLDSEPRFSNPGAENGKDSNLLHDSRKAPVALTAPETFKLALIGLAYDVPGDLAPIGDVFREQDYPAFLLRPTPEPTALAMVLDPTPEPTRTQLPEISSVSTALTEAQMRAVLAQTWPVELHGQALAVACGVGNVRWPAGESTCLPGAIGDQGRSFGLFQLNWATWAPYCGMSPETLLDAVGNAACAYQVYLYDIERGHDPWGQWSVKPW